MTEERRRAERRIRDSQETLPERMKTGKFFRRYQSKDRRQALRHYQSEAELAGYYRDAMRWRWLRDKSAKHVCKAPSATLQDGHGIKVIWQMYGVEDRTKPRTVLFGDALDYAIDEAMK